MDGRIVGSSTGIASTLVSKNRAGGVLLYDAYIYISFIFAYVHRWAFILVLVPILLNIRHGRRSRYYFPRYWFQYDHVVVVVVVVVVSSSSSSSSSSGYRGIAVIWINIGIWIFSIWDSCSYFSPTNYWYLIMVIRYQYPSRVLRITELPSVHARMEYVPLPKKKPSLSIIATRPSASVSAIKHPHTTRKYWAVLLAHVLDIFYRRYHHRQRELYTDTPRCIRHN